MQQYFENIMKIQSKNRRFYCDADHGETNSQKHKP